jgi:hypothetical protein
MGLTGYQMASVYEHCAALGWTKTDLARQSGLDFRTAKKAFDGKAVSSKPARAIAKALSKSLKVRLAVGSIDGLVSSGSGDHANEHGISSTQLLS